MDGGMVGGDNPNQSPERGERGRARPRTPESAGALPRCTDWEGVALRALFSSLHRRLRHSTNASVEVCTKLERCEKASVLEGCHVESILVDDALRAWKVSFPGASRTSSLHSNDVDALHPATGTFFPRFRVNINPSMAAAVAFGKLHGSVVLCFRVVQVLLILHDFVIIPD